MQMEIHMMACLKMVFFKDLEPMFGRMVAFIKAISIMVKEMEKVNTKTRMAQYLKGYGKMVKGMERVH